MTDISTVWSGAKGDWLLAGTQLQKSSDLQTAVVLSLFTDRVVTDDQINDGTNDPRGWWADDADHPIGSRLWLIRRAKQTSQTLSAARDYIAEALQWLIDDGVVASFDIACEWSGDGQLSAHVIAYKKTGTSEAMRFAWAWSGIS